LATGNEAEDSRRTGSGNVIPEPGRSRLYSVQVFSVPTSRFISYNVREVVPYYFNRYILFNKSAELAPLYCAEIRPVE
jgi:hypothetical protein